MSASWASSALAGALVLAGCGGGPSLAASDVAPGRGMQDVPDRRTGGSVETVPTWRVDAGTEVSFSVHLRNTGEKTLRVIGVARDRDGDDQQFVPAGIDAPVTLQPRTGRRVEVRGRAECPQKMPGQLSGKNGQRFRLEGGETADVDFEALIEFVCR